MSDLAQQIRQLALEVGFDAAGIAPVEPAEHLSVYLNWLASGYHGDQAYLARPDRVARRRDPQIILPGARSIIVVGLHYWPGPPPPQAADPAHASISCYAQNTDYHHIMLPRLDRLLHLINARSRQPVRGRAYVDTGPLLERDHALRAGLGFVGKNTNLIQPSRGSWLFLGELLIDLELEPDQPPAMPGCGTCTRCRQACPTQALVAPFVLDSRRCISYWTTAFKGIIPREFRSLVGNHVFGCDICQAVCPWNRFAVPLSQDRPRPAPPLLQLLTISPARFSRQFGHTPIGHIGYERFLRNVTVAAGNWAAPEAGPPLSRLLHAPAGLVRAQVAWALGRIGTPLARTALAQTLPIETDPTVRDEIASALAASG